MTNDIDHPGAGSLNEEVRPFHEFFPVRETRVALHYAFVHRHLPQKLFRNPRSFFWSILLDVPEAPAMEPTRWIQAQYVAFVSLVQLRGGVNLGFVHTPGTFARVADLSLEMCNLKGLPLAFVRMPRPEATPGAHYIGIVLLEPWDSLRQCPEDAQARYFTLEQIDPGSEHAQTHGIVCEWMADGTHRNFSWFAPLDGGASFFEQIQHQLDNPGN